MKLKNVHYEYRGNDIWRIYFKDYQESETFENERTDGKKPRCSPIFSNSYFGIRWYVEAKLTGRFNILRYYTKDRTNDYFSNDIWRALVKKIEGADSDYIFDEIDLWYDATNDKCYFKICCMNGTWTDFFVKNMLNSQFGMVAQANGYYDTDTVGQGGLCTRRSCCGIGYDTSLYKTKEERIMFSVKDYCPGGKADIIKVSSWTNTFIGTNKKNEKEYSWSNFKKYMGLLRSDGSDIWDIEWEYDVNCPMTGTEVADELHLYLKPEAYKRLFEKEDEEKKDKTVWLSTGTLWSNGDYFARVEPLTPPPVPKWVKLDEDGKIGFRQKDMDEVKKEIDEMTKRIYEKLEIKQVKDFDTATAWHEYLTATKLSGADFDGDTVCEYCKRDADVCKEFTAAAPTTQACLVEPIVFINHKPCTLTEFIEDSKDAHEKEANNKEDNNMKIYWDESQPRIENIRDIVLARYRYDRSVYYYRVYFESVIDAKNVMECSYNHDKGKHCWYYMTIASTAELSEEMKGSIKTLYLTYNKNETRYYINWKAMYGTPLKANAHFEMKMTAQLNDEQMKAWEAALGIGNQPKHKNGKTVGDVVEAQKSGKAESPEPTKILVQGTATIIWWSDGTKTVVKCQKGDKMDPEKGIAMCVMKKFMGTNETHSNYLDFAKPAIEEHEKQQAAEKAKKKAEADKKRREAAKKKGTAGNANYKRGAKGKTEPEIKEES
jgi:hypothetical protein